MWTYVAAALLALLMTTLLVPVASGIATPFSIGGLQPTVTGIALWIALAIMGSAWSKKEEDRATVLLANAPIIAAVVLGGPTAAAWVALVGTFELRELRGGVPWYGMLANHALLVVPAVLSGVASTAIVGGQVDAAATASATAVAAIVFAGSNTSMTLALLWSRTGRRPSEALGMPWVGFGSFVVAESALAWLVSLTYHIAWWSPLALVVANTSTAASWSRGNPAGCCDTTN